MASRIEQVSEALKTHLNGLSLTTDGSNLTFVRSYQHDYDLDDLHAPKASVCPRTQVSGTLTRDSHDHELQVDVIYQRRIDGNGEMTSSFDLDMETVEQIHDGIQFMGTVASGTGWSAHFQRCSIEPIYQPEHLDQLRVFTAVVSTTFKIIVSP